MTGADEREVQLAGELDHARVGAGAEEAFQRLSEGRWAFTAGERHTVIELATSLWCSRMSKIETSLLNLMH